MSVAVCLLAASLFTCEWHRPGIAPRVQPKPIEVIAQPPAEDETVATPRPHSASIELASLSPLLPEAGYGDGLAARVLREPADAEEAPSAEYSDSVSERIGLAEPDAERFGEFAYAALPPAIYGDYEEAPKYRNEREKRRAERKAKREMQATVKEFKIKKTTTVSPEETVAYAAPAERKSWLASLFDGDTVKTSVPKVKGIDPNKEGYREVIKAAREHGVPVDLALRVAKQESGGNCSATSHAGAGGVMQVMPKTAAKHGVTKFKTIYDCRTGAQTGVKELKHLLRIADGDVKQTLIGYNCGERCMHGKRKKLPAETVNYVAIIAGK